MGKDIIRKATMSSELDDQYTYEHLNVDPLPAWLTFTQAVALLGKNRKQSRYYMDTRNVRWRPTAWNKTHKEWKKSDVLKLARDLK